MTDFVLVDATLAADYQNFAIAIASQYLPTDVPVYGASFDVPLFATVPLVQNAILHARELTGVVPDGVATTKEEVAEVLVRDLYDFAMRSDDLNELRSAVFNFANSAADLRDNPRYV